MNVRLTRAAQRLATTGGLCLGMALAGGAPLGAQGLVQPVQSVQQVAAIQQKSPPAQAAAAVVEGYSIAAGDCDRLVGQLQQRYADRGDVRIAGDARTRRIVVFAPPDIQRDVAVWLSQAAPQAAASPAADALADPMPARDPLAAQAAQAVQRQRSLERLHLAHLSWRDFETKLFRIWGAKLTAATNANGDAAQFQIKGDQGTTTFEVDRRRGQVTIDAPGNTARDWLKVLQAIDAPAGENGEQSEVVQLDKADPSMVLRAVSLIRTAMSQDPLGRNSRHRKNHIGQFVSMIFQQEGEAAQPGAQPAQPMQPGEGQPGVGQPLAEPGQGVAGALADIGRIGNVEIDIVGDTIVVRGRSADVAKVLQIIEEIERQSIETRPEVELYLLKHVDSTALSELITLVYSSAFSYQGTVTITPLQRPNALLLVGRKENIPAIVELIQKLDRPTPPDSRLKVFYLKHMSAIDMERTLRQFFIQRPPTDQTLPTGLGTRVKVIAEFRANAIIVQAAPRDLAEVAQIIAKLDVEDTPSKNEVRVFKLRNSIASELAQPLQEAITGVGVGGQQQQQQQAPGGAGGQQSPAIATRPAVSLSIMRIGPEGEQLIQSGVLSNMRITADTRSNSLIVVGPRSAMELMAALIEQLDNLPAADAQIKVFTIVNGDATALTEMLQELFGTQAGGGGQAGQLGLQTATGGGDSTLVPLRFSVDQRTNSIIASGTGGDLDVIYRILARLDEGDVRQRITTVYRLHNSPAADVAAALTQLLTSQRELLTAAPELVTPYQIVEREVIVVPEIVTNSLIVSATPRYYDEIRRVITELDRRPPMVAIQVLIAEVTLSDIDEFGIEWGLQDSLLFDRGIVGGPRFLWPGAALGNDNSAASLATRENLAGQVISDFATGAANGNLGFGGLVLQASNESVSVLLRALQQSQRIQVISRPQVQTLDNQPAFVQVGALVPRVTSTTITNGVSQNNTTDENVGIILGVTPRTSPDGMIVMEVNAEKSEVGPDETGIPISIGADGSVVRSPQIFITTAQTTVSARSGQTVILGGLITKNQGETTRRIPYLGDIPVLGRLFRFDSVSNERRELLIILTPHIIQNDEQNDLMIQRETERMSWCIADVVNIHGPVGVSGNPAFNMGPADVIFPDIDPTAPQPTPAAPPAPGLPPLPGFQPGPELPPATPEGLGLRAAPPEPASARRGAEPPAELRLQQPMIQPVQPPAGTQARVQQQFAPSGIAPAVYQR